MVETPRQRLVVVLGMHRSGTSAITRGLQVLGVALGDRLIPPIAGNNDTGFWEDIDVNQLCDDLLALLGSGWDHLTPLGPAQIARLRDLGYAERAQRLLMEKVGDCPLFGLKSPRLVKLLPFWRPVFAACGFEVSYILAIRNPFSVAASLRRRDGFDAEKSYLLWLDHVVASWAETAATDRIVVDYDRLLAWPRAELDRVAARLRLTVDPEALAQYETGFLDGALRHSQAQTQDLLEDPLCPPPVREAHAALAAAAGDAAADLGPVPAQLLDWPRYLAPERLLRLIDRDSERSAALGRVAADNDAARQRAEAILSARDLQVAQLEAALAARGEQVAQLEAALASRERQLGEVSGLLGQREARIEQLLASTSWKLTAPVRYLGRLVGRTDGG